MRSLAAIVLVVLMAGSAAAEPGWRGVVFARGVERQQIKSTPITERPYRPFHVSGIVVRRAYHRGTFLPVPRDFVESGASLITSE